MAAAEPWGQRSAIHRLLLLFVNIHLQEVPSVLFSFFTLFSLLASYFLLLPLREDAGISLGTSSLPCLFACSLVVTLVFTPVASAFLSRSHPRSREVALKQFYCFMAVVLLGFYFLYSFSQFEQLISTAGWGQEHRTHHWLGPSMLLQQQHMRQTLSYAHVPTATAVPDLLHDDRRQHSAADKHLGLNVVAGGLNSNFAADLRTGKPCLTARSSNASDGYHSLQAGTTATTAWRSLQQLQRRTSLSAPDSPSVGNILSNIIDKHTGSTEPSSKVHSNIVGSAKGSVSSKGGDTALSDSQRYLRGAFYVWVNVMNLVGISSLWARCADTFTPEAGARLFGFISAGATLGQLMGSLMAMTVAWATERLAGKAYSSSSSGAGGADDAGPTAAAPASSLILGSAVLQLVAAQLVCRIRPHTFHMSSMAIQQTDNSTCSDLEALGQCGSPGGGRDMQQHLKQRVSDAEKGVSKATEVAFRVYADATAGTLMQPSSGLECRRTDASSSDTSSIGSGGGRTGSKQRQHEKGSLKLQNVLTGFKLILQSRYLLLLCGNLLLTYVVGSLIYFQRALVVSTSVKGPSHRTAFFAALNTWSATCILLMQLFATSSLLRHLGMEVALGLGPLICFAGIALISRHPSPAMVAVFEVIRKVFAYAVYRPSREVLFTVVSREEKYSAKLVIDTVVQRLGDAVAAAAFQLLDVQWSLGQAGVGAAGCFVCFLWLGIAHKLGQHHKRLVQADAAAQHTS